MRKTLQAAVQSAGTFALIAGLATTAHAQAAGQAGGAQATADAPQGEIIVTANKREENLNKVGLSITAVSGEALAEKRLTSVQDIAAVVPGLKFADSGVGTPIYTLRGVGFNESSLGVYPSVSVYLDESPLPFPVLTLHAAFDLQRVEALKGPQGTLFGENATGGAINYVAAKPTDVLRYGGDISYGRFNEIGGNAFISGPLGGGFSARIAVTALHRDGWQQSLSRPGDTNAAAGYLAGRFSLAYHDEGLNVLWTVNAWRDTSQPQVPQFIALRPQIVGSQQAAEVAAPFADGNPRLGDWNTTGAFTNDAPRSERRYLESALKVSKDIGTTATITSLTSYQVLYQPFDYEDLDGTAGAISNLGPNTAHVHSFNQELRISNQGKSALRWVAGANFESTKADENQSNDFSGSSQNNPANLNITTTGDHVHQSFVNWALFGNVNYDVSSAVTLKGGLRYTKTRDTADICGYSPGDGNVAKLFNIIANFFTAPGVPFTPIGTGDCYVLNFQGIPGQVFHDTLSQHNLSWLAGLDYHVDGSNMLYANVSRGYKAGSFPTVQGSKFVEDLPVTQEAVTAYEVGFKGAFADRKVRLNAAAFYYAYDDKQVRGKLVDPIFNILDTLLNVPKSRIYGMEGDINLHPVSELTLGGSVTYLNSKILSHGGQDFTGPNVYGLNQNFTGTNLPFTPNWSYSLNAEWRHEIAKGNKVFAGIDVRGQSASTSALGGKTITFEPLAVRHIGSTDLPFVLPAYATVDGRFGFQFADNGPTISVWGKNILNKLYFTNANQYLDATVRFAGMPATYGVTISFKN